VADDRGGLGQVERLALWQPFDDVDEHDVGEPRLGDPLGRRRADVAGADDRDLVASGTGHGRLLGREGTGVSRAIVPRAAGLAGHRHFA
jgi:hypothetical protein